MLNGSSNKVALPFIRPGLEPRPVPQDVKILLLDFDGVLTDNRVWVNGYGG